MVAGFDVTYGRVTMYVPPHKTRKIKNAIVSIAFFLPDGEPTFVHGCSSFLSYTVNGDYYKIYNPQRYVFDFDKLCAWISHWHRKHENAEAIDFEILEQTFE